MRGIPKEIIEQYDLNDKVVDGCAYVEICGGTNGLHIPGKLSHDDLVECVSKHNNTPVKFTPGLRTHETRNTPVTLSFDSFRVKHVKYEHHQHLVEKLIILECKHPHFSL